METERYRGNNGAFEKRFHSLKDVPARAHKLDYKGLLKHVLYKDEKILLEVAQSRIETLTPILLVATNKRLIIIYPSFCGMYFSMDILNPTTYAIIPYRYIIGVSISKGKILSSIKIHTSGSIDTGSQIKDVDEVYGIPSKRAIAMTNFLGELIQLTDEDHKTLSSGFNFNKKSDNEILQNEKILIQSDRKSPELLIPQISLEKAHELIKDNNVPIVWLGIESKEYISKLLQINEISIKKINLNEIERWQHDDILAMEGAILLSYDGVMSMHTASLLRDKYGLVTYTIKGGLLDIMDKLTNLKSEH
ncbi:MAG: PH domain-containing protein [Candidatus Micrarchaeaceae archaeon]